MIDSIIFDLDGTLWDSGYRVREAWNEAVAEEGYEFVLSKEDVDGIMGLSIPQVAEHIFAMLPAEERMPLLRKCLDREVEVLRTRGGSLMEGLEEILKILHKKYRLFIVSNCQDGYVQTFLEAHHMEEYFEDFKCAGDTGLTKGESNVQLIQERSLKNAVYVGDTKGDRDSAIYAGIAFIYAKYGFGEVEDYQYGIDCLAQLPEVLEKIG